MEASAASRREVRAVGQPYALHNSSGPIECLIPARLPRQPCGPLCPRLAVSEGIVTHNLIRVERRRVLRQLDEDGGPVSGSGGGLHVGSVHCLCDECEAHRPIIARGRKRSLARLRIPRRVAHRRPRTPVPAGLGDQRMPSLEPTVRPPETEARRGQVRPGCGCERPRRPRPVAALGFYGLLPLRRLTGAFDLFPL